jgi:hypothetical protein
MSSSIWTRCAGDSELRTLRLAAWRAVEAQHQLSTRKLVDSAAEQIVLEGLIEQSKPPAISGRRLHYLLSTPFRYPPLRHGSRFGARFERGIWYGSTSRRTAFAEVAYYRLLFLEGTTADLGTLSVPLTAFTVRVHSDHGIDLTAAPFARYRKAIASPTDHGAAQALGTSMRAAGVEAFLYPSARDAEGGINVGVFSPAAFAESRPRQMKTWHCVANRELVEFTTRDFFERESVSFDRQVFLVSGALPACGP